MIFGLVVGAVIGAAVVLSVVAARRLPLREQLADMERSVARADHEVTTGAQRTALVVEALRRFPDGVIVCDRAGVEVFRNPAAEAMGGNHLTDVLVLDAVVAMLESARAGVSQRRTIELFGPPRRTVAIHTLPIGEVREVAGALALVEDVTERLRLEQARSDFVSNISHELRTPVGAMALLAETLLDETDPESVNRLSSRLVNEAHRVGHLIDDLLELTRIENGEVRNQERLVVENVVSEVADRVRPAADAKQISIEVHPAPDRLMLVGDRRQVTSALGNLLENAVRYSDPGAKVALLVSGDDRNVEFQVVDRGMGIPANHLDRIFERFYRVDRARARETGGTGLGLSIVRHVVDNHRGSISVESVEGQGSTFTMRLPIGIAATGVFEETA